MESPRTPLWLPPLPDQDKIDRAIVSYVGILKARLLDAPDIKGRDLKAAMKLGPEHLFLTLMEADEGDTAVEVYAEIAMDLQRKVDRIIGNGNTVRYESPVEPVLVQQSFNAMGNGKSDQRRVLATALTHAFVDDTPERLAFHSDPEHQGIIEDDGLSPDERAMLREEKMIQDLRLLFERICDGTLRG